MTPCESEWDINQAHYDDNQLQCENNQVQFEDDVVQYEDAQLNYEDDQAQFEVAADFDIENMNESCCECKLSSGDMYCYCINEEASPTLYNDNYVYEPMPIHIHGARNEKTDFPSRKNNEKSYDRSNKVCNFGIESPRNIRSMEEGCSTYETECTPDFSMDRYHRRKRNMRSFNGGNSYRRKKMEVDSCSSVNDSGV